MKNLFAESILIFLSVLTSFYVDGFRKDIKEREELNEAIYSLSIEMKSNIEYADEHLKQLENMLYMTNYIIENYEDYSSVTLKLIHDEKPFIHFFDPENTLRYSKSTQPHQYFLWWNAWEPNNILYTNLTNSGKLLEINDNKIMQELESIYIKQKERNQGIAMLRKELFDRLISRQLKIMKKHEIDSFTDPYYEYRDYDLYVEMIQRKSNIELGISRIKDYITTLNHVNEIIEGNYGKLN